MKPKSSSIWRALISAMLMYLAAPSNTAASTYAYTAYGTSAAGGFGRYIDTFSYGNELVGLGESATGEVSYVQSAAGAPPAFSPRADLGLGVYGPPYFTSTNSFASADIDGDGNPDVVLKYSDINGNYLGVFFSSDRPSFIAHLRAPSTCNSSMPSVFAESRRGDVPVIGDINHDGLVDVTVISGCSVFSFDEDGHVNTGWPLINREYHTLNLADLDGDGFTDLLISSDGLLQAMRGNGTEIWHKNIGGYYPAIGDVMGDSQPEIIISDGNLTVMSLDGTVKFTDGFVPGLATPQSTVRLSDVDGDGKLDLITEIGGFVTGGSRIYAYKLLGSKALITGFPVQLPGNISRGGILTANVTKSPAGNDILVPTDSGVVVIGHQNPGILYTIQPGHDISQAITGSTDGTNFILMANIGTGGGSSIDVETFGFTVDSAPVTLADQNSLSLKELGNNARRTGSFAQIPLSFGTAVHHVPADITRDGRVNIYDLSNLLRQYNSYGLGDVNLDGMVNVFDLSQMLSAWTG